MNTGIFILYLIQKKEYTARIRKVIPVTSQIMFLSAGSVEIFRIIYAVPAIPISGNSGPHGTLKDRGAFGRRLLKISTSIWAKI